MRRSYVVPMRWLVIYEYEVSGGTLNLKSTNYPDHGRQGIFPYKEKSPWGSSPTRKNPLGRTGNRTRNPMISSQKLWPLDHEAGHEETCKDCRIINGHTLQSTSLGIFSVHAVYLSPLIRYRPLRDITLWKTTGHVMHHQFNIQQLYVLPTLYLCVLYLSENKQWLVPLTA
jgi:hypothetical protein